MKRRDESPYIVHTLMSLSIRPILKTLTTLRRVGETGKSVIMSSMTMPTMEAITSTKSNTFHPAVKYMKRSPMILTMHCLGMGGGKMVALKLDKGYKD